MQPNLSSTRLDTKCFTSQSWISFSLLPYLLPSAAPHTFCMSMKLQHDAKGWRRARERTNAMTSLLEGQKNHHKQQPGCSPAPIVFANDFLL